MRTTSSILLAVAGLFANSVLAQTPAPAPVATPEQTALMREIPLMALPYEPVPQRQPPCDGNRHILVIDIDRDGDSDLLFEPIGWRGIRLMLNDGDGHFVEETAARIPVDPVTPNAWRICAGDIDGDGDLDIVAGTDQGGYAPRYVQGLIYINDGTTHFTSEGAARLPSIQVYRYTSQNCTALADFDGDGDLDLVLGGRYSIYYDRSIRLLRNDGRGYFTYDPNATGVDGAVSSSYEGYLFPFDADGDGDMDLYGNSVSGGIALWLNDGTARLTDARRSHFLPGPAGSTFGVAAADVDGDGDPDLVATRGGSRGVPMLYLNDGIGHFHDASATHVDPRGVGDVALRCADFDGDGDQDFVTTVQTLPYTYPGGEQSFLNDGTGHFTLDVAHEVFPLVLNGGVAAFGIGDFDSDGDLDTLIPDSGIMPYAQCRTRYYLNTTRQVWAENRPTIGSPWRVVVAARQGELALVAYSVLSATHLWPPMGRLRLDPATMLVSPSILTMGADHLVVTTIPIPNLPLLQGLPLHAQALVMHRNGSARLTNLWSEAAIR
ncbi:MAG: VCBS repeat-containing protein [Planctomycetes bacterium]|nr:VCBS repeat-containing protein [Planctomycetota bacterium]